MLRDFELYSIFKTSVAIKLKKEQPAQAVVQSLFCVYTLISKKKNIEWFPFFI